MGVIPIVNENDTVAIDELELEIGENDSLSATVAAAVGADLLIILSDINGLYSADPRTACHLFNAGIDFPDFPNDLCIGIGAGVGGVQSVDVGQDNRCPH